MSSEAGKMQGDLIFGIFLLFPFGSAPNCV